MSDHGFIKIHRRMLKWEWYSDPKTFCVFMYLLISANHTDGNWQGMPVKRGQVITGRKSISKATGLTERQIRTALSNLQKTGETTSKTTNRFSIVTICNYEVYQNNENENDQPSANKRPANDQQTTTNKNVKNEKNKHNTVAKFMPPIYEDVFSYCEERGNSVNAEKFIDFYESKGWMIGRNKMKDWRSAVRNWEKSSFSRGKDSNNDAFAFLQEIKT